MRRLSILLLLIFSLLPNYLNSFQLTSIQHGTRFMRKPFGARGLKAAVDPNHLDHLSNILTNSFQLADAAVSAYSKVDKTGFIGFIATYIEIGIDAGRSLFQTFGIQNAYGPSILLFTIIVKALTFPLQYQTLESTTKLQKIQPLQQKVMEKYANDQQTKNLVLSQLLQAAKVNPLAGCFPALVQIPIFISLYRALTNLVAENKLAESFLWIPDLQGPVFSKPPAEALDWLKTIVTGNPELGWEKTIAYLSIPVLLFVSQSISQKLLQPPRDPNKQLTDQEQFSLSLVNNLPFIVTFFSLSVPAGLEVYWIANNIFSTIITLAVKNSIKDEPFPIEVDRIMASLDGPSTGEPVPFPTTDNKVFKSLLDDRPKPTGFAKLADEGSASPSQDLSSNTAVPIKVEEVKPIAPTSNSGDVTASAVPPVAPTPVRSEVNRSQSNRKKRRQKN